MSKLYKLTLYLIDVMEEYDGNISDILEDTIGRSRACLSYHVCDIESKEFEWDDGHPLNKSDAEKSDYEKMLND